LGADAKLELFGLRRRLEPDLVAVGDAVDVLELADPLAELLALGTAKVRALRVERLVALVFLGPVLRQVVHEVLAVSKPQIEEVTRARWRPPPARGERAIEFRIHRASLSTFWLKVWLPAWSLAKYTKSGRVRRVPLPAVLEAELQSRVGRLVPFSATSNGSFSKAVKRASGISGFHLHRTRYDFAMRWLADAG